MRCLLVHPSATMRRVFASALRDAGCEEIIDSPDAGRALEQCDQTIGLVITEWSARGTEAIDLTKSIRAKGNCEQARILMVSARDSRGDVNEAIQAGVDGYVLKPFTIETLRRKLEQLAGVEDTGPAEGTEHAAADSSQESSADPVTGSPK